MIFTDLQDLFVFAFWEIVLIWASVSAAFGFLTAVVIIFNGLFKRMQKKR